MADKGAAGMTLIVKPLLVAREVILLELLDVLAEDEMIEEIEIARFAVEKEGAIL